MNKVYLSGNLTRDVEVKYTQSGKAYARVGIAVNRPFSKKKAADDFDSELVDDTPVLRRINMLSTIVSATFKYRGHYVTAQRMVDTLNGKFFCLQGFIDNQENWSVAHKSLNQFEKQFQLLADKMEQIPAFETF